MNMLFSAVFLREYINKENVHEAHEYREEYFIIFNVAAISILISNEFTIVGWTKN